MLQNKKKKYKYRERLLSFGEGYKEIINERVKNLEIKFFSMYGIKSKQKKINKIDMKTYVRIKWFTLYLC